MLKVSGKWLSPGELENCLLQHVSVREVAVVGVKNADGLIKPCAFVVTDHPSAELAAELQAFAKRVSSPTNIRARWCSSTRCRGPISARSIDMRWRKARHR